MLPVPGSARLKKRSCVCTGALQGMGKFSVAVYGKLSLNPSPAEGDRPSSGPKKSPLERRRSIGRGS